MKFYQTLCWIDYGVVSRSIGKGEKELVVLFSVLSFSSERGSKESRMVVWYTVRAVLPSRVWVAEAHAPLETGESWFESSKTLTPHYSPGHVCDDVEGTQDSRGWLKCVPAADTYG